jgi:AraC-like DNA-binding protein
MQSFRVFSNDLAEDGLRDVIIGRPGPIIKITDAESRLDGRFWYASKKVDLNSVVLERAELSPTYLKYTRNDDDDYLSICLQSPTGLRAGGSGYSIKQNSYELASGDVFVNDMRRQTAAFTHESQHLICCRIPRRGLRSRVSSEDLLTTRVIRRSALGVKLLRSYLNGLVDEISGLAEATMIVAEHVHDLVSIMLKGDSRIESARAGQSVAAARFVRVREHLIQNALDPAMSAEKAALQFGVTSRYIFKLFAMQQVSFSQELSKARLSHAERILRDGRFGRLKILDVALRCGFNDPTTFNRHFIKRFGMSPGDFRLHHKVSA